MTYTTLAVEETLQLLSPEFLKGYADYPEQMNALGKFVYLRTYSRFLPEKSRRETWKETCVRSVNYNVSLAYNRAVKLGMPVDMEALQKEAKALFDSQFNLKQALSGRTLWVGGAEGGVAHKYPLANFNCSFTTIRSFDNLADIFYLLLVGTGAGIKATKKMAKKLPKVKTGIQIVNKPYQPVPASERVDDTTFRKIDAETIEITVGDSKEGWVEALRYFFRFISSKLYKRVTTIEFNYNNVRDRGERLKTFGGTASGPYPLMEMFARFVDVLQNRIDPSLAPIETDADGYGHVRPIHLLDFANLIGNNVVVGGVRRTAEIFLFDADDYECMFAKYGLNGIWGEEGFAYLEEVKQKLIKAKVEIPEFMNNMHRQWVVYPDPKDFMTYEKFDCPDEATVRAVEYYGQSDYNPEYHLCHVDRMEALNHRRMSNNSVAFTKKPKKRILNLIFTMMKMEGEPGFINLREAAIRRLKGIGILNPTEAEIKAEMERIGLNPCAEILLNYDGVCNLTTVNVTGFVYGKVLDRVGLLEAQRLSARAGYRMTLVELELKSWDETQQRDRLLGTSLTGWRDAIDQLGYTPEEEETLLEELRVAAREEADRYADSFGLNRSRLVTTVKPEGTLSQVFGGVSSGLHYAHSEYYIRRVRINADDPLAKAVLKHDGWIVNPENDTEGNTHEEKMKNARTLVIDFPIYSGAKVTKDDATIEQQFENYFMFQRAYTEHNASNTMTVKPHEWKKAENIVWNNWNDFTAVSFLAHSGGTYKLAPYESCSKEEYEQLKAQMQPFSNGILQQVEIGGILEDALDGMDGCEGGACPIR